MSEYRPNRWCILKITTVDDGILYKVLGGWYGGYAGSDRWRASSGISQVDPVDENGTYAIHNHSGSIYYCHRSGEGTTGLSASVLSGWIERAPEGIIIEVINLDDLVL